MSQVFAKKNFRQKYHDVMPTGAGALFLIQIFATIGFSVLYSTLILYATNGLHMNDTVATSITGSFVALNYFLHLLGGYVGGRYLSYRSLFGIGMLLTLIGCALISIPQVSYLLWGLAFFLSGAGLNVTCINCMVTQLFEPDDKRRESAFLWNYSGMNIGFLIGFSISGYYHLQHAYHQLFLFSSIGSLITLILLFLNWRTLKDRNTSFIDSSKDKQTKLQIIGFAIVIALIFTLKILLNYTALCNKLILIIGVVMLAVVTVLTLKQPGQVERNKMWSFIILALSAVMFYTLYQLMPMGLNLFIERNVDRHFLGFMIAPQWVQDINDIIIIIGGPLLSVTFSYMRERGVNISLALQFSFALLMIGIGMAILPLGISFANPQGYTSFIWIFFSYVLTSIGELFLAPIGYAMIGQLAPLHLRGLLMGFWMMIIGVSATLSDRFSKLALGNTDSINPVITNASYSHTFGVLGWSAIITGVILFVLIPTVTRLSQEKKLGLLKTETDLELNQEMSG